MAMHEKTPGSGRLAGWRRRPCRGGLSARQGHVKGPPEHRTAPTSLLVGVVWVGVVACETEEPEPTGPLTLDDSYSELAPELEPTIDGEEALLSPVDWVGASSQGILALLEPQHQEVRLFDGHGEETDAVGGQGEGPGEFESVSRIGWKGDTLWVADHRLDRVSVFSPDFELDRTITHHESSEISSFQAHALLAGDTVIGSGWPSDADMRVDDEVLVRMTDEGQEHEVLTEVPQRDDGTVHVMADVGIFATPVPFTRPVHWSLSPNASRIVVVEPEFDDPESEPDTGHLVVTVLNERGERHSHREIPFDAEPITSQAADSAIQEHAEDLPDADAREEYEEAVRELLPPAHPPVEDLVVGSDHSIWLRLRPEDDGQIPWLMLDPDGEPQARLMLSEDEALHSAGEGELWLTRVDETDVPSVIRGTFSP